MSGAAHAAGSPPCRRVIFNADDFGASQGINRGIVEAHTRGVLRSASLMMVRPALAHALELIREHRTLDVGLHWDIEGEQDSLGIDAEDVEAVRAELVRQLEDFTRLVGRPPTHLDSHHHVHREEHLRSVFAELAASVGAPLRDDGTVAYVSGFYAQWEWKVTNLEYVSFEFLAGLLRREVRAEWTEIGCHPGYRTEGFHSVYDAEREAELQTLTDPRLPEAISGAGLELASFADLPRAGG